MPLLAYLNLGLGELAHTKLTVEIADRTVKHPKGIAENILVGISKFVFPIDFIILDMPEDVKVPLILGRPFLSTAHAKIDVFKRKITLKARLMGETLILNRSLDLLYRDYIELNDLNVPSKLRRDQVNDLMPTIEEGEVVDKHVIQEVKTRNDDKMVSKFFGYTSGYEEDEKILVEDMDPYLDEGMGEVVSEHNKMNEILHPYQKLKGFYKGVLNLEPDFIRDAKMEEWLTRGHISEHEME
ncbi:reverse transcriptase domain-containing protein [Tanacetum coccineum]